MKSFLKKMNFSNNYLSRGKNPAVQQILLKHLKESKGNQLYFQNIKTKTNKRAQENFPDENESIENLLGELKTNESEIPHISLSQKGKF